MCVSVFVCEHLESPSAVAFYLSVNAFRSSRPFTFLSHPLLLLVVFDFTSHRVFLFNTLQHILLKVAMTVLRFHHFFSIALMPSNRGSFKAWLFLYNGWLWGICLYTFFFSSFLLNKVNTSIAVSQENIRIKKKQFKCSISWFFFCLSQFVHYASENFCPTSCSVQCAIQWVSDLNDLTTCRTCLCITIDLIIFFSFPISYI